MQTSDATKQQLQALLEEISGLIKLSRNKDMEIFEFHRRYQNWYTRAVKLVELLVDRL
jgi:hypothetical protein